MTVVLADRSDAITAINYEQATMPYKKRVVQVDLSLNEKRSTMIRRQNDYRGDSTTKGKGVMAGVSISAWILR